MENMVDYRPTVFKMWPEMMFKTSSHLHFAYCKQAYADAPS